MKANIPLVVHLFFMMLILPFDLLYLFKFMQIMIQVFELFILEYSMEFQVPLI
jgi:hypothetical protein